MAKADYVDGFVIPIPKKNTAAYKKMAKEACAVWKRFGALDYRECIIEDVKPQHAHLTFPQMAKTKSGESVWFSYIAYKSRAHRDSVNKKVITYFGKKYADSNMVMPFDMKRFSYAGFEVIVSS